MKITAQEENGLRILLEIATSKKNDGITIPEISEATGLTSHNVAKLCRILRLADFIASTRGHTGGYMLAHPAEQIKLLDILDELGGRLYDDHFCESRSGETETCSASDSCSVRSLWQVLQSAVDSVLQNMTLRDLFPATKMIPVHQVTYSGK